MRENQNPPLQPAPVSELQSEFLKRLLFGRCGRFRLPFSKMERMFIKLNLSISRAQERLGRGKVVIHKENIAPEWSFLFTFLKNNRITSDNMPLIQELFDYGPVLYISKLESVFDPKTTDGRDINYPGRSISFDLKEALSKVAGELLERYFLASYKKNSFISASYAEMERLDNIALFPVGRYHQFLPPQTKIFPAFQENTGAKLSWVQGQELLSGLPAFIPAQRIFHTYNADRDPSEPYLCDITSSGGGAYFTLDAAILSSIYENVQRDGSYLYWLNSFSPPRLLLPDVLGDPTFDSFRATLERKGFEIHFLDTTSDLAIPSITCVLIDRSTQELRISTGSATGFDTGRLLLATLLESFEMSRWYTDQNVFVLPESYAPFTTKSIGLDERRTLWRGEKMYKQLSFFFSGESESWNDFAKLGKTFNSPREELDHVTKLFKEKAEGYEIYLYKARHPVLEGLNYHVVKTIIPKLFPHYRNEYLATINSERLREGPILLKKGTQAAVLNTLPHPFR